MDNKFEVSVAKYFAVDETPAQRKGPKTQP